MQVSAKTHPLADLCMVTIRQHVEVGIQASIAHDLPILLLSPRLSKYNIFPNSSVL
jgi:hypothetical protein